ncbi:cardiolipin synthase [Cytobacillus sp. FJAT-54145]|uniref:Cardiolipin synthase n=1 Tax=Cytobacillus spartinae TaxID=3299023 RepID=A0ABW6KDS3_9BACI
MILTLLILLGIWLVIDYKLGRKQHLKSIVKPNPPYRQSNLEVFTRGQDLFNDMFTEIKNAKKHIHVMFYIVKDDTISEKFMEMLIEKAKAGVEVRLLFDYVGSFKVKRKSINALKQAGVQIHFCHIPKFPFIFYSSQVRNHRKITVIDGVKGYLGGFNVGKEYVDLDPKLSPWRDYHLKITGEGVEDLQTQFLHDWFESTKTNLLQSKIYFPPLEKGNIKHQTISSEGFLLEDTFSDLIKKAKDSITIGTPYFIPSNRIFSDLMRALDRGVKLTILVPKNADHPLVQEASYRYFRPLIKKGANIYQYMKGFYHAKTFIIDEKICDLGTANFDRRSLFLNHEINCYVVDQKYINKMIPIIQNDLEDSRQLSLKDLNKPNPFRAIKEGIARVISHFL